MFIVTPVLRAIQNVAVFTWDFGLEIVNVVTPKRKVGHVTPEGEPGAGGNWPEYIPPKEGDSRCCCPALNALANHGIIARDGKNIKFSEMPHKLNATYNFAPSFTFFVPNLAAHMLKKSFSKDTFDLAEIDLHNGIEHDASLTREDTGIVSSQAKPHVPFIKELLALASGKDEDGNALLTAKDISEYSSKRRVDARATNPNYSLDLTHKLVGSSNATGFLTIFGGRVSDIESILIDERIPDGWESRIRKRKGLTFAAFNPQVYKVEKGIDEKKYQAKIAAEAAAVGDSKAEGGADGAGKEEVN